jgi:hypothetical protein
VVPHLGVGGGKLSAVGIGRFHASVAVFLNQGDAVAGLGQGVGTGDAGDTAADDGNVLHEALSEEQSQTQKSPPPHHVRVTTPSVCDLRDSPRASCASGLLLRCAG